MATGARGRARHPGRRAEPACAGAGRRRAPTALLDAELTAGDVVLFKSSRDAGLRWLGDAVASGGEADAQEAMT